MELVLFLVLCLTVVSGSGSSVEDDPLRILVEDYGYVQGTIEEGNEKSYDAWYGIPFAVPPTGHLRFEDPLPPLRWKRTRDATYPRSACFQLDPVEKRLVGSEDCLYLNVYRPHTDSDEPGLRLLPVLVVIHGGNFQAFSADPKYLGPDYFMDTQEVIVVNIQYRLGMFGFLASGDVNCKGNFGLKDQNMALRWIKENIEAFGGDPKKITVMGQSAGAASVQYQMMNTRYRGLFKRGIIMSGSALAFWTVTRDPETLFRRTALELGIPNAEEENTAWIVALMREKSPQELIAVQLKLAEEFLFLPVYRPVIEEKWSGAFITRDPKEIWKSGKYEQRQFLTGVTGYEEGLFGSIYYNKTLAAQFLADPDAGIMKLGEVPPAAVPLIKDYYFDGNPNWNNVINTLGVRERVFDFPMYKTVDYYTRYGDLKRRPVDLYRFNFTSDFSAALLTNPYPIEGRGASHGDDLLYLFRFKALDALFVRGRPERKMTELFVHFMVDYVRFGRSHLNEARCRRSDMRDGICEYMDIQRSARDRVRITASNDYNMEMVEVNEEIDRIVERESRRNGQ